MVVFKSGFGKVLNSYNETVFKIIRIIYNGHIM
ncbi:hypothetical protein C21_04710 [Arenibacter sp. NBRC 103722]|nr:hypothetical protein C21_04710 [Arenibacter sp. NBRC 103722]